MCCVIHEGNMKIDLDIIYTFPCKNRSKVIVLNKLKKII